MDAIDAAMDDVADMDATRQGYAKAATEAAMKACGPRELVWKHPTGGATIGAGSAFTQEQT